MPTSEAVSVSLAPLDRSVARTEEEGCTIFDGWLLDPVFEVVGLPQNLPFGLYELDIETPDADHVISYSQARVERNGTFGPLRVTLEADANRLRLYFVLHGDATAMTLNLLSDGAPRFRVGSVRVRRVSTTRWRLSRAWRGSKRRVRSPRIIGSDLYSGWEGLRNGGILEVRRRILDVINPTSVLPDNRIVLRIGSFMRRISVQNDHALAQLAPSCNARASLSIVIPVYRTPEEWMLVLIDSINRQTDRTAEVVFVFDGDQPALADLVRRSLDQRASCQIVMLPQNRGVSAATNAGIRAAKGDYVVVVDHDDILEAHFVQAFRTANASQLADIYFADEALVDDKMTAVMSVATRGQFDIRHYLSHPYIVHPIFIRRSLAVESGLLDETLRISHDVEFFLRCVAKAIHVVQIPLVLYFWRTHASSLGHVGVDHVLSNTRAAVTAYLERTQLWDTFEVLPGINFNELDVRPPLPSGAKAAIVIPTKNGKDILSICVRSIVERTRHNRIQADIYVIDHQSTDPATLSYLAAEQAAGRIRVVPHVGPWNYSQINNMALRKILPGCDYSHVVFMNNDIELVTDDWLDRMMAQFSWGDIGVVGCCLQYPDGRVQHGGVVVGLTGAADHSFRFHEVMQPGTKIRSPGHLSSLVATRDYSAVTAALMIVPVSLFEAVGGFDENLAIGFNDTDLCLRIGDLGYHSTYVGSVLATHYESVTRSKHDGVDHPADTKLFEDRYREKFAAGDPYYGRQWDMKGTVLAYASEDHRPFELRLQMCRKPSLSTVNDGRLS